MYRTCCLLLAVSFASGLMNSLQSHAEELELVPIPEYTARVAKLDVGACSAVAVNSLGETILFHRGKRPIICLDRQGNLLRSWGDDLIRTAHGIRIDTDDNIWATDIGGHRVFKFDSSGKLLLALGTGKPGDRPDQFNQPTDIAFGANGEFYVSDGYGNSRVLKFSPQGKLLHTWGTPGKGEGEFDLPHSILVDGAGRVIVGDRENDRVQVFDTDGKLLEIWNGFAPYGMAFDHTGSIFVADARATKVIKLADQGKPVQSWGTLGTAPGEFQLPHMLCFDGEGHLLVAEVGGKRLQKFRVNRAEK